MEKVSEHVQTLSYESRERYIANKVLNTRLRFDPYTISNEYRTWQEELDALPRMQWNDMFLYCVSTPSSFTREEIKVSLYVANKSLVLRNNHGMYLYYPSGMEKYNWR